MVAPAWDLFVALVVVVTIGVVGLARLSANLLRTDEPLAAPEPPAPMESGSALLLNLGVTHLGIAVALGFIIWLTAVPLSAVGLVGVPDLLGAILLGVGIYIINEGLGLAVKSVDGVAPERYREFLAPEGWREWAILLGLVLPILAFSEELLFRGALIGGVTVATGISPWALAIVSSAVFGLAHTAQGPLGVVVTGILGILLAAVFVVTGDLLLVVIAHYLVNAMEFVVHEGLGVEWPS